MGLARGDQLGIGIELLGCVAENAFNHSVDVLTARWWVKPVAIGQYFGVFDELAKADLRLPRSFSTGSSRARFSQFLLQQFDGYPVNRFLDVSLREYVSPLDFSDSIAEEGGVSGTLLTHHSMKFAAHSFPAPGRPLLEAEQSLGECFLSWHVLLPFHLNKVRMRFPSTLRGMVRVKPTRTASLSYDADQGV